METISKKVKLNYPVTIGKYTMEQQIIATVWYHERLYTGMTYDQLSLNFKIRFQAEYPSFSTLKNWNTKLFKYGSIHKKKCKPRTSFVKFIYEPYVRESFTRFPDLTLKGRAEMLGISLRSVRDLLQTEISPEEVELLKNKGKREADSGSVAITSKTERSCLKNNSDGNGNEEDGHVEGRIKIELVTDEDEGNS